MKRISFDQWHFKWSINIVCSVHYVLFADASFSLLNRNLGVRILLTDDNRDDNAYFFDMKRKMTQTKKKSKRICIYYCNEERRPMTMASADVLKLHTTRWKSTMLFIIIIIICRVFAVVFWSDSKSSIPFDRTLLVSFNMHMHTIDKLEN